MNRHKLVVTVVLVLGPAYCGRAAPQITNPYQQIAARNVFGLRPQPSPVQKPTTPVAPLPNIILTGITTLLGDKRAFLEITLPPKPSQPQKPISCILTEGQQEEGVEVLKIDLKAASVKVMCSGTVTNLTFEKNGRKTVPQQPAPGHIPVPLRQFPFRTAAR